MHILYQMTCLSWVISSTFSNPERRYTTENIMTFTHNVTRHMENSRAITINNKANSEKTRAPQDDEDKKTLAQQVADGKYGLIQKELFLKPAKRPGIISYEINPEVPRDNINNLGGLEPEEIWLAENHLLVLKGGSLSSSTNHRGNSIWPVIDDYVAPKRQVKIPSNPKIPPPFPVQLKEGGPIQFIRPFNDSVRQIHYNQSVDNRNNSKQINMTSNNSIPQYPASLFIPPGSGFPSVLKNITELDEDDPRIYYPPPYDFVYSKDNFTTQVPPGPLVPGIILPPPPNFFASLQSSNNLSTIKTTRKPQRPHTLILSPKNKTVMIHLNKNTKNSTQVNVLNHEIPNRAGNKNDGTQYNREEVNNGWIPIPGHSQTSDEKAPTVTKHFMKGHYMPNNIRLYKNLSRFYPVQDGRNHYLEVYNNSPQQEYSADIKEAEYYSTTPQPFEGFHPLILNLPVTLRPTMAPIYPYPFSLTKDKKFKETYIFYGDQYIVHPNIDPYQQTTNKPLKQYLENEQNNKNYEGNTSVNPKLYNEPLIKDTQNNPKELPYYDQTYMKVTHQSEPTFQYIYYNNNNKPKDGGYAYDIPIKLQSHYEQHEIGVYNVQNVKNHKMNHQIHPTTKTPIYEYSFSAPGYGTVEAPKIATTPKPNVFENTFTSLKRPQYAFFEYQTTPKNVNIYRYHSTNAPKQYTTLKPNFERNNGYSSFHPIFRTESQLDSFFTHDSETMDNIGKKYLSDFGQKLNNADLKKPLTTPLPLQNNQGKPNLQELKPRTNNPTNNKEHTEQKFDHVNYNMQSDKAYYNIQSDQLYYEKPNNYPHDTYKFSISKPQHTTETVKYPQIYSTVPDFERLEYEPDTVRPNHPLAADINVNYKSPPPLNPEAEFIDPQYVNHDDSRHNTYISYQLPGSGGHFYFLTPRSIKAENYHLANSGFHYPNSEDTDHYQNSQHRVRRRKRPQKNAKLQ